METAAWSRVVKCDQVILCLRIQKEEGKKQKPGKGPTHPESKG